MSKQRILYISSNHPAIRPGGLESYTLDLYESLRGSDEFEPMFIARAGPPFTEPTCYHGWSPFAMVGDDPNQYLFYTNTFADHSAYDPLFGKWANKVVLTRFFREFLLAQKPDLVHIQHTIFLGYDLIRGDQEHAPRRADRLHAPRVRSRSATVTARWSGPSTRSSARRNRRGAATSASPR